MIRHRPESMRKKKDEVEEEQSQEAPKSRRRQELDVCAAAGKIAHLDYYSAVRHAKHLTRYKGEGIEHVNIYQCPRCAFWHIGRPPEVKYADKESLAQAILKHTEGEQPPEGK